MNRRDALKTLGAAIGLGGLVGCRTGEVATTQIPVKCTAKLDAFVRRFWAENRFDHLRCVTIIGQFGTGKTIIRDELFRCFRGMYYVVRAGFPERTDGHPDHPYRQGVEQVCVLEISENKFSTNVRRTVVDMGEIWHRGFAPLPVIESSDVVIRTEKIGETYTADILQNRWAPPWAGPVDVTIG